ncbi:MAG: 50S ribosomal protein L2 [candidate division FCPU426 bacterium]
MGIKSHKPTSPSRRSTKTPTFEELTRRSSEKSLTKGKSKSGGRNNMGVQTSRHRGGGHKRSYRVIDFLRAKVGVPAKVVTIEYDPNRTARIALLHYADGAKSYILAPDGLEVGTEIHSGAEADIKVGNSLPVINIPEGTMVHNVELHMGRGGQMGRTAGAAAQIVGKDKGMVQIKLPSGEIRVIHGECRATIGQVGNLEHENTSMGKAGRHRWMGYKGFSRGVAKNPCDHPMGGGEGKTSGGRHPVSPWGQPTRGYKTRSNKSTDRFIVRRRVKKNA